MHMLLFIGRILMAYNLFKRPCIMKNKIEALARISKSKDVNQLRSFFILDKYY